MDSRFPWEARCELCAITYWRSSKESAELALRFHHIVSHSSKPPIVAKES